MKTQRARMMHPSGKPTTVPPVWAAVAVQMWYQSELDRAIGQMSIDARRTIIPAVGATPPVIARDEDTAPNAAGVVFRCDGEVLLLRRAESGVWGFPGGGIDPGETAQQAAQRECIEEMRAHCGPLGEPFHVQEWHGARFATFKVNSKRGHFTPTLNDEHTAHLWIKPDHALRMLELHPGVRVTLQTMLGYAEDAYPTKQLQRTLQKWGDDWQKRFNDLSDKLSDDFAARSTQATQTAMMASFRQVGFTVAFKPTKASIEAYRAIAAEQVGLIKSIPQKYLTDVQAAVWESVKRGGDLRTLSQNLEKTYGVTRRRAALIARDQNAKAKATIEAVRHRELGIKQAIWMHSHAGKEPRPTHVKMNNKLYDLSKGMWDSDEQRNVFPGELINCRCTMRPYIPGFETTAYPEWEIDQT